jgi:hypothetical protein
MKTQFLALAALAVLVLTRLSLPANADIIVANLGRGDPTSALGSYALHDFGRDGPEITAADWDPFGGGPPPLLPVMFLETPAGDPIGFTSELQPARVGDFVENGWLTWSHEYTGFVYWTSLSSLTITMPASVVAFRFYLEPADFAERVFDFSPGVFMPGDEPPRVGGSGGATGFGFYATGGDFIQNITIDLRASEYPDAPNGFAIGEFGIATAAVPEPGSVTLLALGLLGVSAFALVSRKK